MKSKMKKFTSIAAMSAILASTSLSSVFASSGIVTGATKSTQVHVGILDSANKPDQINVTVPTMLALTVHADKNNATQEPKTYIGGSVANGSSEDGTNYLTFTNKSTRVNEKKKLEGIPLSITGIVISAESNTPWAIKKEAVNNGGANSVDKYKLNLKLNEMSIDDLVKGQKIEMYFKEKPSDNKSKNKPFPIPEPNITNGEASPRTANMKIEAKAGGKNSDYQSKGTEGLAPAAFTIEWKITSNSATPGIPEEPTE